MIKVPEHFHWGQGQGLSTPAETLELVLKAVVSGTDTRETLSAHNTMLYPKTWPQWGHLLLNTKLVSHSPNA